MTIVRIIYTFYTLQYTRDGIFGIQGAIQHTQLPREVNRGISVSTNKLDALFHNLRLLFRLKKPNYTEPMVRWNEEDTKTGLIKIGVTHYEPPGAQLKKIACRIRPPVIFIDHDCIGAKPELFAAFQKEMTSPGFKEELEKARDIPTSEEAGKLIQRLMRFITMSGVKIPSPECDAFNKADLNLPHLGLA